MLSEEEMAINRLECGNTAHSKNADYIQLAIKALKKQVPMKPKFYNCNYYCNGCGDLVGCKDTIMKWDYSFCKNCGQKLDWGDSN